MRRSLFLSLALLAAVPALAADSRGSSNKKKPDVCTALLEKRLELGQELDAIETGLAAKKQVLASLATDVPTVDMTLEAEPEGEEGVIDLTREDEKLAFEERLARLKALQSETKALHQNRVAVEQKLARVASTLSQSCPAAKP